MLPTQLLPCLVIPFVELFPNLCLGWWLPPSLAIDRYKQMWYLRVPLQFIAFYQLFDMLHSICTDSSTFVLLVLGLIVSIVLRNLLLSKEIDRIKRIPLWNTNLPWDKRQDLLVVITSNRPTDMNNFDEIICRYVPFTNKVGAALVMGIMNILRVRLNEFDSVKLIGASATLIVGAMGISGFRFGSWWGDHISRCLFAVGFYAVLFYTAQVADSVKIKAV